MGGHAHYEKTKYQSIHEIPDELVKTYSKRDPNNPLYKTRRWVNFKKKQILFQQNDGVPGHMRTPISRFIWRATWMGSIGVFCYNIYLFNKYNNTKK